MSIYLELLKGKIGYTECQHQVSDSILSYFGAGKLLSDVTISIATDHRSLGQVVVLEGNSNAPSDKFSSIELHEKSKDALNDLKNLFKARY